MHAVIIPVMVFVAPGPEVTSTTPVRRMCGPLLVPGQDKLKRRIQQRVVDIHRRAAGKTENVFDPLHLQSLDNGLRA